MPVLLRQSTDLPSAYDRWAGISGKAPGTLVPNLGAMLEEAFEAIADDWLDLGKALGSDASAVLAHTPSCAANISDLGLMLAWAHLVERWVTQEATTLVVCDDPWMFRHLQECQGVESGTPPGLAYRKLRLWFRGYAARTKAAFRFMRTSLALRFQRGSVKTGAAVLLVYGHPGSTTQGVDGYFGDLMEKLPHLQRLLHVDCPEERVIELARDERTLSLHAFASPGTALLLPFAKWRPVICGKNAWLVRRAAAIEGGTGQAAVLAWQAHCHGRWLQRTRPKIVAWPWENHSWERDFIRRANSFGVMTIGYQHSVVGRHMLNYGPVSNPDGVAGLPDQILTTGRATLDRLMTMGVPKQRMKVGGALRYAAKSKATHDPHGPVFVALPFEAEIARQMIEACREITGRDFLLKNHPMSPFSFEQSGNLKRTSTSLTDQGGLAGVLFAATTVGQEAILAGLPTWRFQPENCIAMDILPDGMYVPTVSAFSLQEALEKPEIPGNVAPETFFAPVAMNLWQELLKTHD